MVNPSLAIIYIASGALASSLWIKSERNANDTTLRIVVYAIASVIVLSWFQWSPKFMFVSMIETAIGIGIPFFIAKDKK